MNILISKSFGMNDNEKEEDLTCPQIPVKCNIYVSHYSKVLNIVTSRAAQSLGFLTSCPKSQHDTDYIGNLLDVAVRLGELEL